MKLLVMKLSPPTLSTDSSETRLRPGASFIRVRRLLVAACVVPSAPIFVTLMKEAQD
jgi:hypothetical protein